jgi:hypothetical protein
VSKKTQLIVLGVLVVILLVVAYRVFLHGGSAPQTVPSGVENYPPIGVENPELQVWKIKAAQRTEYKRSGPDIFTGAPAPSAVVQEAKVQTPTQPVQPVELPPSLPVKFFGYGSVPASGQRRAFFTNGEDVYIVAEGETLLGQFRVLHIGNGSLDFEVISSGKRGTVELEWQSPSA